MITLTGITASGTPHLGNYVGAIRPALDGAAAACDGQHYFFLADYHALIKNHDPEAVHRSTMEIAATWLACGLDPQRVLLYRQSDIAEIPQLAWLLSCCAAKGLLNRAHAYKDAVAANRQAGEDEDRAISMGLFCYPVLMAADILMFNAARVPVGRDQLQHLEMARDIAARFNHRYGDHFRLPEAAHADDAAVLPGLDGRKMSKSYNNTIPLFCSSARLKKAINKIKTDLREPGQPKDPEDSAIFALWRAFADAAATDEMRREFASGIAWGEAKARLFRLIDGHLAAPRARYEELMADPQRLEQLLLDGAQRARRQSAPFMERLRHAVGIRPLTGGG